MTDLDDDTSTVIVTADSTDTPDVVVDEGDTTVIVEPPADSTDDAPVIDPFTERFVAMELRLAEVESRLYAKADYEDVTAVVDEAVEELLEVDEAIVEATDDAIVDAVETAEIDKDDEGELEAEVADTEPVSHRTHWLFRNRADWANR